MLYFLEPEVSGGHGVQTDYISEEGSFNNISDRIRFLHYEFDGWWGDDILESAPAFIVTKSLASALKIDGFTGYVLEDCLVTKSDVFNELQPDTKLPTFVRFIPVGTVVVEGEYFTNWSGDDFCITPKGELVVTNQALLLLKRFSINNCDIQPLTELS